jgi:hypothetical protein
MFQVPNSSANKAKNRSSFKIIFKIKLRMVPNPKSSVNKAENGPKYPDHP